MDIRPIAYFESPLKSKFGIPRQSGLVNELQGRIVFVSEFGQEEAVRGLEDFDYLWLIWEFSENREIPGKSGYPRDRLTVRPPRLGGNRRLGVFATRSPFRPNPLGLSCVKIDRIVVEQGVGPVIYVRGADLMDGTPIYDIKPYVTYADAHPEARSGFVDKTAWQPLEVRIPDELSSRLPEGLLKAVKATLEQDPRPPYHDDPGRVYGMRFQDMDVRFKVADGVLSVIDFIKI